MNNGQTTLVQTEIPTGLLHQAQKLIEAGWFRSLDEVFSDALRRFLESHRTDLMEGGIYPPGCRMGPSQ